jgi:hypothetical protein
MKYRRLLFLLILPLFLGCEDDPIKFPGEKPNSELYGVDFSNVLVPGSFLSTYMNDMRAAGDEQLTDQLADAKEFAIDHVLSALKYFVPTGDITDGSLVTTDVQIPGSSATGTVLTFHFTKNGEKLAYQVSETGEGYLHEGFDENNGTFTKVVEALEITGDLPSGTINNVTDGSSTTWEYTGTEFILTRDASTSGETSELIMEMATSNGTVEYFVDGDLRVEYNWLGSGVEGQGVVYDINGDIEISGDWPLIPVPPGFDTYRIVLFDHENFYETIIAADVETRPLADGDGTPGGWNNLFNEVRVQASYLYIPDDATVEVTPSGLKRTYSYTAKTGESIIYSIQATTPSYVHVVNVDGVDYFRAEETRGDQTRITYLERLVNVVADGEGIAWLSQNGAVARIFGRGNQSVPTWAFTIDVQPDNSSVWASYFYNAATADLQSYLTTPTQLWVGGNFVGDAASGEYFAFWFDETPATSYSW